MLTMLLVTSDLLIEVIRHKWMNMFDSAEKGSLQ